MSRRLFPKLNLTLNPYRKFAPPPAEDGNDAAADDSPREFTPEERAYQRRMKLQLLIIGGVAVGGIVCMMALTALALAWNASR